MSAKDQDDRFDPKKVDGWKRKMAFAGLFVWTLSSLFFVLMLGGSLMLAGTEKGAFSLIFFLPTAIVSVLGWTVTFRWLRGWGKPDTIILINPIAAIGLPLVVFVVFFILAIATSGPG